MAASLRRLVKDHATLRNSPPPNYIFPDNDDASTIPDDLTQLLVLITGAEGTPYSQGLWRLHLKMPEDYPKNPPKATFRTKIYHPNVEEKTGAVCLETLKRDWDPKLTLKDILITISCLLIQPNPDSALNAGAGALIQEDYDAFSTQAKLMTKIHASIPFSLLDAVQEARRRGEEPTASEKIPAMTTNDQEREGNTKENALKHGLSRGSKEVVKPKRPLAELYTSPSCEEIPCVSGTADQPAEQDQSYSNSEPGTEGPLKKSPKLMRPGPGGLSIFKNNARVGEPSRSSVTRVESDKENIAASEKKTGDTSSTLPPTSRPPALRKVSNVGTRRVTPRVGIRRL
ncbi:hypothetical protein LTR84_001873 [Exophiala bonariae]|uniref:UBC core domain-containing protein n=1 Tax=Exophiala bonariae TaxID=1690606 RepID=A0AAV9NBR0_9EURO|nr:hypothetical protein LTR84_001873 [Exophiala bonariae]